ncbi:hypothetical protein R1flu_005224 [Riccia fluitans]|uniref:DNA polymerase eta n=1 Tax=Riccia fluitans TaxID=41844 RepID=A0ABD1YTD3_9MARC
MPVARPEPLDTRVIAHVDLDCFYVQVEQRRQPQLKGKPTAVVQYNPFRGGAVIAVGYEARRSGVTRNMRGDDARKICPDINLVQVPVAHGKADLSIYRDAGTEVVEIFSRMGICERASIDEVYLDITEAASKRLMQSHPDAGAAYSEEVLRTHVVGIVEDGVGTGNVKEWVSRGFASRSDQLLACGAVIIAELRTVVVKETQFTTSAGIAHNKMLAKLASAMHKPAQQTLIPSSEVETLFASMPTKKIKYLGGKLGRNLESDLGVKTMGDLLPYSEAKLQSMYGFNTGTWLWMAARGMNGDEVEDRTLPKSHGCGKTFPGPTALKDLDSIRYWLTALSAELQERLNADLELHKRKARLLVVHASCHMVGKTSSSTKPFPSKSCTLRYGRERIASDAIQLFRRSLSEFCPDFPKLSPLKGEATGTSCAWAVTSLSVGAQGIYEVPAGFGTITRYFGSPATSNAKAEGGSTAAPSESPSPHPQVLDQSGTTPHDKVYLDLQDEEVISLNEPDENILKRADLSSGDAGSVDDKVPSAVSPCYSDEDGGSHSSDSELPASPNAYSVLRRRQRSALTLERKLRPHQQSGECLTGVANRPSPSDEGRSNNCKPVKRNLMDTLDPSVVGDEILLDRYGLGLEPLPPSELSDVASDHQPRHSVLNISIPRNQVTGPKAKSAGLKSDVREVIQCSPLESVEPTRPGVLVTGEAPECGNPVTYSKESQCSKIDDRPAEISKPETAASLVISTITGLDHDAQQGTVVCVNTSFSSDGADDPPSAGSTRAEGGTAIGDRSRAFSGGYKGSVFKRVDELWEKWKLSSQKPAASDRIGLQGEADHKRRKRLKSSISDFFARSSSK